MNIKKPMAAVFLATTFLVACSTQPPAPQPAGVSDAQTQKRNMDAWAGNWSGTWSGNCVASMKISDVTTTSAVVVHEYGDCGDLKAGISADNSAKIDGTMLSTTYLGFDIVYNLSGSNAASGVMTRGGAQVATGQFTRP